MKRNTTIFTLLLLGTLTVANSQTRLQQANDKYEKYAYVDAIKSYERIVERGYKSNEIFQKLGNAYYFNADFDNAAKWYGELFPSSEIMPAEYYYRYAQSLKAVGNYEKSDAFMKQFASYSKGVRGQLFRDNQNYLAQIEANSGRYSIKNSSINTQYSDYGATIFNNQLIFTSARDASFIPRKHSWTNENFTNLYSASIHNDSLLKVNKFASRTSSKFHESTPVFTKDGKTMYFTRNNYINRKRGRNAEKITLLQIYKATLIEQNGEQKWSDPKSLPFNSDEYSTAHPALSDDGQTMYFASDMPGTIGQSDLFSVEISSDGDFKSPINLGPQINTEGRESFPFVVNNELYFASDGRPGLGGFDIYVTSIHGNSYATPQNIGAPANSPKDDFAYYIDAATRKGFLSSNRDGGVGNDDIYQFTELKKLGCEQIIMGLVSDKLTNNPIENAKVTLSNADFTVISTMSTDEFGRYRLSIKCDANYYLKVEKTEYFTNESAIELLSSINVAEQNIALDKIISSFAKGDDLAKVLQLNPIYFDLDKWNISPQAELELQRVLEALNQNPKIQIAIHSHTDSRQSTEYNKSLSQARANSTLKYLVDSGISQNRLSAKGFGESKLLNHCSDGVECSEEQHQLNRRSEFIVLSTTN